MNEVGSTRSTFNVNKMSATFFALLETHWQVKPVLHSFKLGLHQPHSENKSNVAGNHTDAALQGYLRGIVWNALQRPKDLAIETF